MKKRIVVLFKFSMRQSKIILKTNFSEKGLNFKLNKIG